MHIDRDAFLAAIAAQPETFCSHDIIDYFHQHAQQDYVRTLYANVEHPTPFTAAHGQISAALHRYPEQIAKEAEPCKHPDPGARWHKVVAAGR